MSNGIIFALGSIDAVRPVFLIVMGVFLNLIAWRLAKTSEPWTGRIMVAGALMLGIGYAVIVPLYEAGVLERYSPAAHHHGSTATALAWQVVKTVVMNGGWLLFGIGAALHAQVFSSPAPRPRAEIRTHSSHESVA